MARIRTVKPDLFRHEALYEAESSTGLPLRLAFIGLFTVCDREGRFPWKPRALKLDILPFDDGDFASILEALAASRFVFKYQLEGKEYGFIPSWLKHQVINTREAKSVIPPPPDSYMEMHVHAHAHIADTSAMSFGANVMPAVRETIYARDGRKCLRCGSTEDLTIDHIFPQCMGGTHAITNLRTLCRPCNSARPVHGESLIADLAKDGLTLNDMQRMCMHVQEKGEGKGREKEGNGKGKGKGTVNQSIESMIEILPGLSIESATEYLAFRKAKKCPLTPGAWKKIVAEIQKSGLQPDDAVNTAMARGWQGFEAEWLKGKTGASAPSANSRHHGFDQRDYNEGLFEREDGTYGLG